MEKEILAAKKHHFVKYDQEQAYKAVNEDYLQRMLQFENKQFECHFQINPSLFLIFLQSLAIKDKYWREGNDCTKQSKIKPEVKLLAVLMEIAYRFSFSLVVDYFQTGENTAWLSLLNFACEFTMVKK